MKFSPLARATRAALATLLAVAGSAASAQALLSSLKLEFAQPTGTVLATDDIPVYVRITNTDTSQAFNMDSSLPFGGLNPADVPTDGYYYDPDLGQSIPATFASYVNFSFSPGYGCSGSFTDSSCNPAAYSYQWGDFPPTQLAAGASQDYLFVTFKPVGGAAPAGTYEFYRSLIFLYVTGEDTAGHVVTSFSQIAVTCDFDTAAECAGIGAVIFSRDVTAVPEPATLLLMAGGLAAVAALARRRRAETRPA